MLLAASNRQIKVFCYLTHQEVWYEFNSFLQRGLKFLQMVQLYFPVVPIGET